MDSFYSGNFEKNVALLEKDSMFQAVTLAYTVMAIIMMFEYFLVPRKFDVFITSISCFFYVIAFLIRIWGIKTLGKAWQTKLLSRQLITAKGPYRLMRHPVYFGFIIEIIAVPLIPGTYYALLYSIVIFLPLLILKTLLEEKHLLEVYKGEYREFMSEKWAFFPLQKKKGSLNA